MRAIMVCVDYGDLLAVTLPYNRHHFEEVCVVTTWNDEETECIARMSDCLRYYTNEFYEDGAIFNKWMALESALDVFERKGLMCIMDPDVLWPKDIGPAHQFAFDRLYTPRRRILDDVTAEIPDEKDWKNLPLFSEREFAGYSQIFHADDPRLPEPPWHEQDWIHAGGADSAFQNLWKPEEKIRPEWEVLHLGRPGLNWCGRSTIRRDGTAPENAEDRKSMLDEILHHRKMNRNYSFERIAK